MARAAHGDAGVLLITGNYAGDVMNFGLAVQQLRGEGIDARYLAVTDDIASAAPEEQPSGAESPATSPYSDAPVPLPRRGRPRHRRAGGRKSQRGDPNPRRGVRRLHHARRRAAAVHGARRARWISAWASTASRGSPSHAMPTAAELADTLVDGVLAETPAG